MSWNCVTSLQNPACLCTRENKSRGTSWQCKWTLHWELCSLVACNFPVHTSGNSFSAHPNLSYFSSFNFHSKSLPPLHIMACRLLLQESGGISAFPSLLLSYLQIMQGNFSGVPDKCRMLQCFNALSAALAGLDACLIPDLR